MRDDWYCVIEGPFGLLNLSEKRVAPAPAHVPQRAALAPAIVRPKNVPALIARPRRELSGDGKVVEIEYIDDSGAGRHIGSKAALKELGVSDKLIASVVSKALERGIVRNVFERGVVSHAS